MAQQDNPKLTITLTGRAPVKILKDDWPVAASAHYLSHDGQIEAQATRTRKGRLTVRVHEDGRTIVYGVASYHTQWQGATGYDYRRGILLDADRPTTDIPAAIMTVASDLADAIGDDEYAERMRLLAHECIADLPAEEL